MIISHQHKFIFFAIPKTGTHSIRFALRPFLGEQDEEHVNLFKQSKLHIPALTKRSDGHISVREIKPYLNDEIWTTYFKFCFVRNPWDRFVSTVFFRNRNNEAFLANPLAFLEAAANKPLSDHALHYQPQLPYLVDEHEQNAMDFIGKTENMQADFDMICNKLGLDTVQLDHRNQSEHDNYKTYYTEELKQQIAILYQDDIEAFGYSF